MPDDTSISPPAPREAPWTAGIQAARANLVPGLILQGLMLSVLLAYYFHPPMRGILNDLADIKARRGYGYSAANAIIAGAVIPELLRILVFQKRRLRRSNVSNLLFTVPFWCVMGLVVDFLYRCQVGWFGSEPTFAVVLKKVLVDQFLYNPLYAAPVTAWLYDWKNRGFRTEGVGAFFTVGYYRDVVVPTLFATWGVWIPVVAILYSLPSLLQIPLFGLALSLWVIIYTWMSEQRTISTE
ncbi:hypothetical protein JIN84_04155 [Luteolibacter yonseiensis]|uniref:Uncharacterized protein n=1 Tax=Luteolibacter yonseiensis TaxID=1144680 RepID=A0A934V956_9BACT|nr:hypothetical protein [Luteolibacter yonseiensis]MBK1814793.1 hypothetical protein [Luteolibacter yonseiensis]